MRWGLAVMGRILSVKDGNERAGSLSFTIVRRRKKCP
jgi:hypothetical protein